jgi:hypothetical protein
MMEINWIGEWDENGWDLGEKLENVGKEKGGCATI